MNLTPATLRLDLKCGRGSISPGDKCSKGQAQKNVAPNAKAAQRHLAAMRAFGIVGAPNAGALNYANMQATLRAGRKALSGAAGAVAMANLYARRGRRDSVWATGFAP